MSCSTKISKSVVLWAAAVVLLAVCGAVVYAQGKQDTPQPGAAEPTDVVKKCGACHFRGKDSQTAKEWQKISPADYSRSMYGRKGVT